MKNIAVRTLLLIACTTSACTDPISQPPPSDPVSDKQPLSPSAKTGASPTPAPAAPVTIAITDSSGPLVSWDFGLLEIDAYSPALVLTITNNTDTVSDVLQIGFSGGDTSQFTLAAGTDCIGAIQLAPGASCSVRPQFAPTSSGDKSTTLAVDGGVAGSTSILLSGTGAPQAILSTAPYAFSFNVVQFGQPATETFSLVNSGVDVVVQSITIGGSLSDGAFSVASTTCTGTFASGASCSIVVEFNPADFGELNGNLAVMTDHGPYTVGNWVSGQGGALLTVSTTGTGFVYSNEGYPGIDCGMDATETDTGCSGLFITPDNALAVSGNLISWGGACSGADASCSLTLGTTPTTVTATFAP